ncbi:hypothetical protein A7982_13620 [Minicystis rosea]|nr:hypothetical protein A7982_13620 [Minicystis rosea]
MCVGASPAVLLSLQGCAEAPGASHDAGVDDANGNTDGSTPENACASAGATRCEGGRVATCKEKDGAPTWSAYEDCPSDQICKQTACETVTTKQLKQADAVEQYANDLRDYTGYFEPIDFATVKSDARRLLFLGDESEYALAKAIHHVFRAVPQGHAATGFGPEDFSACMVRTATVPLRGSSWYGVCGRAAGDSSIITFAAADNPMGLVPGDRVVKVTKNNEVWQSPGFLARVGEEPLCDGSLPSQSAREDYAAANLFALLDEGAVIDVQAADGSMRTITVPARTASYISCYDPLRRPSKAKLYASSQRADGVVVIILPTLGQNADHPFPAPLTVASYRDWVAEGIDLIKAELAKYSNVTGLVWDLRGNSGGSQELGVGLIDPAILGTTEGAFAKCFARIPASSPPGFKTDAVEYPIPYQGFVDSPLPSVGYTGKQAVVVDGTAYSAGDWMVYAAKKKGIPIVGHASAGAYGYTTGASYVKKHIAPVTGVHSGILSFISGAKCVDTAMGKPMDGTAPIDVVVDFKPTDLAKGIDTQLEAAASIVLEP